MKDRFMAALSVLVLSVSLLSGFTPAQATSEPVKPSKIDKLAPPPKSIKLSGADRSKSNPNRYGGPPTNGRQNRAQVNCPGPFAPDCYRYAGSARNMVDEADGFQVDIQITEPALNASDQANLGHSLFELSIADAPGASGNIVELIVNKGWPCVGYGFCLTAGKWKDGNFCGWGATNGWQDNTGYSFNLGDSLTSAIGTTKALAVVHYTTPTVTTPGWWLNDGTNWLGVFPDSIWNTNTVTCSGVTPTAVTFVEGSQIQAFSELALLYVPSESDMGDGHLPTATTGMLQDDLDVYATTDCDNTTTFCDWNALSGPSQPDRWNIVDTGVGSARMGGPGGHTTVNNLPAGDSCSGVGIGTDPGGYGMVCPYQNTSGGVPITQITTPAGMVHQGSEPRNTCFPNMGKLDGLTTSPVRVFENTTWVKWAWFRDANCAGANHTFDHGTQVLPAGWTNLDHASLLRWSTVATCNGTYPNTCK